MKLLQILVLLGAVLAACSAKKPQTHSIGQIKTDKGEILFWLYDETPRHKESFIKLARANFWDSLTFNRVIPDFVVQGGCPDTKEGFANSPYLLDPEFNDSLKHVYGAVGAGRDDNPEMSSAGCQFYIVQNKNGLPRLDGKYTVFGKVIKGMDVVDAIVSVARDSLDSPLQPIKLDVNLLELSLEELRKAGCDVK